MMQAAKANQHGTDMDDTKQPLGVATMVHGDYFFLERWYRYYSSQVGAHSLYIFSHGGDPEHRRIAPDANVINIPRDETMHRFDRRRWRMLSNFTSGMLQFYHWMILADVDELVLVLGDAGNRQILNAQIGEHILSG